MLGFPLAMEQKYTVQFESEGSRIGRMKSYTTTH